MYDLIGVIRRNRLYAGLVVFIVFINVLSFLGEREAKEKAGTHAKVEIADEKTEKQSLFDPDEVKKREERIKELSRENPIFLLFLGLFNITVIFFVFTGVIFDIYFLVRFARGKPVEIRTCAPPEPGWNMADVVRVALIFLSAGYLFAILQVFVIRYFPILRNENFRMIFDTTVMNVVGIGVMLYFVMRKYGQRVAAIGLTLRKAFHNMFYALVAYISLVPVTLLIMIVTMIVIKWLRYEPPVQPIVQVFMEEKQGGVLFLSTVFAAVFGPIAEEIFFRGFMYTAVKKALGVFWGCVITAVVFSLLHAHVVGFLPIMALGILLAYIYEKTGSLVSCISVHVIHNVAMVMVVFLMRHIGA